MQWSEKDGKFYYYTEEWSEKDDKWIYNTTFTKPCANDGQTSNSANGKRESALVEACASSPPKLERKASPPKIEPKQSGRQGKVGSEKACAYKDIRLAEVAPVVPQEDWAVKQMKLEAAPVADEAVPAVPRNNWARRGRNPDRGGAPDGIRSTDVGAAPNASLQAERKGVVADSAPCPICGKDFAVDIIQVHVDSCLSKDVVELPSKAAQATPSSKLAPSHSVGGSSLRVGKKPKADVAQCPICGQDIEVDALQAHAEGCFSAMEVVALPSKADQATPSPKLAQSHSSGGSALSSEDRKWAVKKIEDLVAKHRVSHLDANVALESLCLWNTSADMRSEAVSLIWDNQPVKNFAAELWRRKSLSAR